MTTWYRDFSEYSTGELGSVGSADFTVYEGNATWLETVTTDAGATGGQTLVVSNNGQGSAVTSAILGAAATSGDCEVYARIKIGNVAGDSEYLLGPALSDSTRANYQLYLPSTTTVRLVRVSNSGGLAAYVDAAQSFSPTADTYFKIRIGRSGTTIRAKIWADGDGEPGTWNAGSGTDTTLTTIGASLSFFGYVIMPVTVDVFGAATAGDTAPTTASGGSTVTPTVGDIRVAGQTPTVSRTTVGEALPDTGTLRFVGGTPTLRLAVPEVTSPRVTGNNTASGSWAVGYPAHSAGDLVLIGLASDANVTHGTLPGGPNSETAVVLEQHAGDTGTATVRASLWYWIATDAEAAGTVTVTPSASEQWSASAVVIPAGQFDPANPVQDGGTGVGTTGANTCPPFTATLAGGRVGYFAGCDADTISGAASGWYLSANQDIGAVSSSFVIRNAATTASESVSGGAVTGVDDGRVSIAFVINAPLSATAAPSVGTVRFVGQTPSVSFPDPQTASPTVGTLVFVGQTPTIGVTQAIAPSVGTLRFVGQTPTVAYIANVSVSPSVGTLRFVGQQLPLFDTSALVDFDTPAKNLLTGADQQEFRVLVRKNGTTAPTVDIDLYENGSWVADLVTGTSVTSDTGQIVSATWNAALLSDISGAGVQCFIYGHSSADAQVEIGAVEWVAELEAVQTPTVGVLRFAGQQPTVQVSASGTVQPFTGTLRFDGQAPTVGFTHRVAPVVGAVQFVGQQPAVSVGANQSVAPTVGLLRVVGQQPTTAISDHRIAAPQVGTLRFAGNAPTLAQTQHQTVAPSAGTVRVTGNVPVLSQTAHVWVVPSAGTLRIVGNTPLIGKIIGHASRVVDAGPHGRIVTGHRGERAITTTRQRVIDS